MYSITSTHPLLVLKYLEQRCLGDSPAKQHSSAQEPYLKALGVKINDCNVLIETHFIKEVLTISALSYLSTIPRAKPWLLGLISFKGQALSVIDLKQFIFKQKTELNKYCKLLVISHNNALSILVVEASLGVKRWALAGITQQQLSENNGKEEIVPFTKYAFNKEDLRYCLFSIEKLFSDENFRTGTLL